MGDPLVGLEVTLTNEGRIDALLFGEAPSRIVVAYDESNEAEIARIAKDHGAPFSRIGITGGAVFQIEVGGRRVVDRPIAQLAAAHRDGLAQALGTI
jgi:hypothetical protein